MMRFTCLSKLSSEPSEGLEPPMFFRWRFTKPLLSPLSQEGIYSNGYYHHSRSFIRAKLPTLEFEPLSELEADSPAYKAGASPYMLWRHVCVYHCNGYRGTHTPLSIFCGEQQTRTVLRFDFTDRPTNPVRFPIFTFSSFDPIFI